MARSYGQHCGVSTALELVGERGALLIVRDLLVGPRRFTDLRQGLPRVPTNILTTRLRELQEAGVVRRAHLAHCGLVYELTEFGRDLEDVVLSLSRWGSRALGEPGPEEVLSPDALTITLRSAFRAEVAAGYPATRYGLDLSGFGLSVAAGPAGLEIRPVGSARPVDVGGRPPEPDLTIRTSAAIHRLIGGRVSARAAVADGLVELSPARIDLLDRFARTFRLAPGGPGEADLKPTVA